MTEMVLDGLLHLADHPRRPADETRRHALEIGRTRLLVTGLVFAAAFAAVAVRLVGLTVLAPAGEPRFAPAGDGVPPPVIVRTDITDRNGEILATSLPTAGLYADPAEVLDPAEAAARLVRVLPWLDAGELEKKLGGGGRFVWLVRNLTPRQQWEVNRLGVPGLHFQRGEHRVYPQGRLAAHVLGFTDVDGRGIAGVERRFDGRLQAGIAPLVLSLDIRIQDVVRTELGDAMEEFKALGAAATVLDVHTGEVLALASLPDFDPNDPGAADEAAAFNRVTKGVYEMGSTFKLFTVATALDSGSAVLDDTFDATRPLKVARYTISDYHPENRWLSVPEILIHSSNIGAARLALGIGSAVQRRYLARLGLLEPAAVELPEVGRPLMPDHWREINTMTIAFGHGVAVSPLQLSGAVATLVNGGVRRPATLLKVDGERPGERVLGAETSRTMRALMRLVVARGTGRKADVPGYRVGGKTGTAEKMIGGRYQRHRLISSFVGAFPMDAPRFVVLAVLDEPKGTTATRGYATGGWVATPMVGRMVSRLAPLMGIAPDYSGEDGPAGSGADRHPLLATWSETRAAD